MPGGGRGFGRGGRGRGGRHGRCRRGESVGMRQGGMGRLEDPDARPVSQPDVANRDEPLRREAGADLKRQAELLEQELAEVRSRLDSAPPLSARQVAIVNHARCTACGLCVPICPKKAIRLHRCAEVDSALCSGCGACLDACPVEAIDLQVIEA